MATIIKRPYGYQLRVTHKLLPKDLWATFDDYETADRYGKQLEGLLAQGIVPAALLEGASPKQEIWTVQRCIDESAPASVAGRSSRQRRCRGSCRVGSCSARECGPSGNLASRSC
jgi:hypothetical protein